MYSFVGSNSDRSRPHLFRITSNAICRIICSNTGGRYQEELISSILWFLMEMPKDSIKLFWASARSHVEQNYSQRGEAGQKLLSASSDQHNNSQGTATDNTFRCGCCSCSYALAKNKRSISSHQHALGHHLSLKSKSLISKFTRSNHDHNAIRRG